MEQILAYGILRNKYAEINKQAVLQAMGKVLLERVAISGVLVLMVENLNSIFSLPFPCFSRCGCQSLPNELCIIKTVIQPLFLINVEPKMFTRFLNSGI